MGDVVFVVPRRNGNFVPGNEFTRRTFRRDVQIADGALNRIEYLKGITQSARQVGQGGAVACFH